MSAGGPAMKPLILWPFENSLQSRLVSIHLCSWTKLKDTQLWNMIMQEKCNVVGSQGSLSFKVERASSRKLSKVLPVSVFLLLVLWPKKTEEKSNWFTVKSAFGVNWEFPNARQTGLCCSRKYILSQTGKHSCRQLNPWICSSVCFKGESVLAEEP